MNILITGANGQLGNEMRVLSAGHPAHTYFFTDVEELDICNAEGVKAFVKDNRIDVIVNCAAYTAVDKAEDNAELCDRLNHLAPGYLAEAAEAVGAALVQISTDYVFDGTAHIPYTEDAPTMQPHDDYPHRLAILHLRRQLREDHAPLGPRARLIGRGVRPDRHPDLRRRLGTSHLPGHRAGDSAGHLPLQQRRRLLVVRLHPRHTPTGGHHHLPRQPPAHGRISRPCAPPTLLRAGQGED